MFAVSANNKKGTKCGKRHKYRKGSAHGNKFRKNAGKQLAGKSSDGVEHKESTVEASLYPVRNVRLCRGNADVIRCDAKNSYHEAQRMHNAKGSVKIDRFDKRDAYINKKRDAELLLRRKLYLIMYNTAEASSDNAENRNKHEKIFAVFKGLFEPGKSDYLRSAAGKTYDHEIDRYRKKPFFGNQVFHAVLHVAEIARGAVGAFGMNFRGSFDIGYFCFKNRRKKEEDRVGNKQ